MAKLAEKVLNGDRLALSRLITQIENNSPNHQKELDQLFAYTGKAYLIGITGPSGSGKSTLVNHLAQKFVGNKKEKSAFNIGIIAVDPTSPFSGGALLGDRIRMRELAGNPDIFIRSMATRGALGGIAAAVDNTVLAMDAAGFHTIIVETVGAGQSEVEIAQLAHTTIVVEAPGLGDDIQAAKAGILEIADVLVVNKSDKQNADSTVQSLKTMLNIDNELTIRNNENQKKWQVPVVKTAAIHGEGIEELANVIRAHHTFLEESGIKKIRSHARVRFRIENLLRESLYAAWLNPKNEERLQEIICLINEQKLSPFQAVQKLLT